MRQYKTFSELKLLSKRQMSGHTGILICALIVQELILFLATSLVVSFIPGTDVLSNTLYYVVTFIIQLLSGLLQAGCCLMYLNCACNMPFHIGNLFHCFTNNPDKVIKIELLLAVINCICMLPSDILVWMNPNTLSYDQLLFIAFVTMLCTLLYSLITLAFVPVFYIMFDYPQFTVREIYQKSMQVMKGNKIRYLLLQLSFFPWFLLSMFTLCIPLFWVVPYMNMTNTNFYLDIMAASNRQSENIY